MLWFVWILAGLIAYTYVGYPLLIWLLGRIKRRHRALPENPSDKLTVCIVVAAYNEERVLAQKLDSLLRQTYSQAATEIVVVDDGSHDNTRAIAAMYEDRGVRLMTLPRGGKAAALNAAVRDCRTDIVAYTDADTLWLPETLHYLLAPFADLGIGGVAGHVTMLASDAQGLGDRAYRGYETLIRRAETRAGSCTSADGGLFAVRRSLVQPVPPGVTDDFFLSTGVVAAGRSLVYEPRAIVLEKSVGQPSNQYQRRVRITVRGMESLWHRRTLMNPLRHGVFAIALFSHKLLRRLAPAFLLLLFPASGLALAHGPLYQMMFITQAIVYALAVAGIFDYRKNLPKPIRILGFILLGSVATLVGVMKFLCGVRYAQWVPQKNEYDSLEVKSRDG